MAVFPFENATFCPFANESDELLEYS